MRRGGPAPAGAPAVDAFSQELAGLWRAALDPDGRGEDERWYARELAGRSGARVLALPGSVQEQGLGDEVSVDTPWTGLVVDRSFYTDSRYEPYREPGNVSVPFWLQPKTYYRGAAWFQRSVDIPSTWAGRRVALELERVHWESTVWLDRTRVGSQQSLSTPHRFDLGELEPGRHLLTIRVDNRTVVDVGPNAHSISDHTQGNWNGVIGALRLTALPPVVISGVSVHPRLAQRSVTVKVDIACGPLGAGAGTLTLSAARFNVPGTHEPTTVTAPFHLGGDLSDRGLAAGGGHLDVDFPLGPEAQAWDEFHPALYELTVTLEATTGGGVHHHERQVVFGLREVGVVGTQVSINGRPTFIRGTLECCVFPLTGYPPTDVASWRRIIEVCRSWGLNLLRFHSWCPPEAAFRAADEAGFYFQVEGPVWANQGASLGESRPLDRYLYEECWRLVEEFGNHPCFVMMAHGNEPSGRDEEFLTEWVGYWRRRDSRRLYTSGAGWPAIEANDFDNIPGPRTYAWDEGLGSRLNAQPPETETDYSAWVQSQGRPVISHEIGEWCAYPNFEEVAKYTGLMQPRNFAIFADFLAAAGMTHQARDFLYASGRLQTLCYKEEIEAALRTPGFAGFHLLGLTDFPGQGTALVGVLDAFWQEKTYCTAAEFSRFCGPTVPLARLPRRVWRAGEVLTFEPQVAHFGPEPLDAVLSWQLLGLGGTVLREGRQARAQAPIGNTRCYASIDVPLEGVEAPQHLRLVVSVTQAGGQVCSNDWDLWVYPGVAPEEPTGDLVITRSLDEALARAQEGETVLFLPEPAELRADVGLGFTTVFWNTAWTGGQAPHTLGILHDQQHPLFEHFPSTGHTDWQWWELLHGARAMVLDLLPPEAKPVVQPIDTWFSARRLGLVLEAAVGRGRLLICSMDVLDASASRPAAQQFWRSMVRYASGPAFAPQAQLEASVLRRWFVEAVALPGSAASASGDEPDRGTSA